MSRRRTGRSRRGRWAGHEALLVGGARLLLLLLLLALEVELVLLLLHLLVLPLGPGLVGGLIGGSLVLLLGGELRDGGGGGGALVRQGRGPGSGARGRHHQASWGRRAGRGWTASSSCCGWSWWLLL